MYAIVPLGSGCQSTAELQRSTVEEASVQFIEVGEEIADDPTLATLVAPYRARLESQTSAVIGHTPAHLTKDRPEGTLGNFAADAMLHSVQALVDHPVDMALTNNGGLRTTIGPGDITVGLIFEVMPFENMLTVLEMGAEQVDSLAQQLARNGGDPIAGFSFVVDDSLELAYDIRVGGKPLERGRRYRLVTSDYLAGGGGPYAILRSPSLNRRDLPFLVRDALLHYVQDKKEIEPVIDGRITIRRRQGQ